MNRLIVRINLLIINKSGNGNGKAKIKSSLKQKSLKGRNVFEKYLEQLFSQKKTTK